MSSTDAAIELFMAKDMDAFEIDSLSDPELRIYCFQKSDVVGNARLAKNIVRLCERVQDRVWTKKFHTSCNSVAQDFLLVAYDDDRKTPAGFFSGSVFENGSARVFVYVSDAMILPEYRGGRLLAHFFKQANLWVEPRHPGCDLINIVASGYINVFTSLETKRYFARMAWPPNETDLSLISNVLKGSFDDLPIDANGVVRSGWCEQDNNMQNVWPHDLARKYRFPLDVDYFKGDVLVRLYRFEKNRGG